MDVVLNADIQSPLVRTLAATQGKANTFVHHIKDNIPPVSFGKLELTPEGGALGTYQRNYSFRIPPYGFWRNFILKFQASENGLGTLLIRDIYTSLIATQETHFYGETDALLDEMCFATYNKNNLFGCLRNGYGAVAPNSQVFVPQGWVSPFDGNVRSGNYDPWESMWLRCIGGNSYGNQAGTGTYPNPQVVLPKGDARIAPYRQVPRFDALNAFGRQVHCIGNEAYDDGNTTGSNLLQAGACGYNLVDGEPGITTISLTSFTAVNNVPSGSTLVSNVPSGATLRANVPSGATLRANVPSDATLRANVPFNTSLAAHMVESSVPWNSDNNAIRALNVSNSGVPVGATIETNSFPTTGGTWSLINNMVQSSTFTANVVAGAILSDTSGNQDVYFGQSKITPFIAKATGVIPADLGDVKVIDITSGLEARVPGWQFAFPGSWDPEENALRYTGTGGNHGGVPHDATLVSNVPSGASAQSNVLRSSTTLTTRVGVPINASGVAPNVPSDTSYIGANSANRVPYILTPGFGTNRSNIPYGATLASNVPSNTTLRANVPSDSTLVSNVPSNSTLVNNVVSNAVTSASVDASNLRVSAELDWSYLVPFDGCMFHQVPRFMTDVGTYEWFLQPDGQYAGTPGPNTGSRGWAASTPPDYNTNTQMRNRYLGQRLGSTYDWCSQANLSRYLGALMVQKITLSTHDRIIQTIYPAESMARIHRMPTDQKKRFLSLIRPHITSSPSSIAQGDTQTPGYTGEINTTGVSWMRTADAAYGTYRTFTCYFPCFFAFFEEPSTVIDTRFNELLTVDVLVSSVDQIYDPCDLGYQSDNLGVTYDFNDTAPDDRGVMTTYTGFHTQEFRQRVSVINTASVAVTALCYYHNFNDTTCQAIRDANFRPNVPRNVLGYNTYMENPISLTAQQICQGATINMTLTCSNLASEIIFCVRRVQKDVRNHPILSEFPFESLMTTLPIQAVALTGSGQLLYQGTGAECMLADQWDYALSSIKTGSALTNDSGLYADSHESYYTQSKPTCDGFFGYRIPFSFSTDRTYNSGCLALQSINAPVLSVQLAPLHGWVINDDNLAFRMGSLFNLSENLNQRECDTQTVFDGDFELQVYVNYFQLIRMDSNTGQITKSLDI